MSTLLRIARPLPWVALSLLALLLSFLKDIYLIKIDTTPIEIPNANVGTGIGIIGDQLNNIINNAVSSTNKYFGQHKFYRAHIMGYCIGQLDHEKETDSSCTYTYDVVVNLKNAIGMGGVLGNAGLPIPDLDSAVNMLAVLYKTIFALYFLGTLAVMLSMCFTLTPTGEYDMAKVLLDALAFITLSMASTIGTTFALKLHEVITSLLEDLGITGSYSSLYVLLTWTAVAIMLAAMLLRIIGGYRRAGTSNMKRVMNRSLESVVSGEPRPAYVRQRDPHQSYY